MEAAITSIGLEIPLVIAIAAMLALALMRLGRGASPAAGAPAMALSLGGDGLWLRTVGEALLSAAARLFGPVWTGVRRPQSAYVANDRADTATARIGRVLGGLVPGRRVVPLVPMVMPERLSLDQQWGSAAGVVVAAISGARSARVAHETAGEKLDAAAYALERLMVELGGFARPNAATAEIAVLMRPTPPLKPLRPRDRAAA